MATDGRAITAAAAGQSSLPPLRLVLLLVIVTLLWGINWPVMKVTVSALPPFTFRVFCISAAGCTLLLLARLTGERIRLDARLIGPLCLASLFSVTGWHMFTAYGLLFVGGGRAAIIAYTMPIWAALLSVVVLGERFNWRRVAALAVAMVAMAILIIPDLARLGGSPLGTICVVLAAVSWAGGIVATKAFDWRIGTLALSGWQLLTGGIPIVLAWPFVEPMPDLAAVTTETWLALAYVTFVALVFCFSTHVRLIRIMPASVAALMPIAIPVVGVISSAIMLGEPVGLGEVVALSLVLLSLALVVLPSRRGDQVKMRSGVLSASTETARS